MVEHNEPSMVGKDQALAVERIKKRLDMLDHRLDNIDSMVTAVAERVMRQPVTLSITCPHCGKRTDLFKTGGGEKAAKEMNVPFLGKIPFEPEIVTSGDEGKPFVWERKDSQAVRVLNEMVDQIMKNLKPKDVLEKKGGG